MANQTCNPQLVTQALDIQATGPRTVIVPADPIIWDEGTSYEYLTLVASTDFGQGYVSKRDVPAGTPLTNTDYWIPVASYNAQLSQIQADLQTVKGDVDTAQDGVDQNKASIAEVNGKLDTSIDEVNGKLDTSIAEVNGKLTTKKEIPTDFILIGDSWLTDGVIADKIEAATGLTVHNMAKNGSGWATLGSEGTVFSEQLSNASALGIAKEKIGGIMVIGGVNDFAYNTAIGSVQTGINNFKAVYDASFKGVPCYYVMNAPYMNSDNYRGRMVQTDFPMYYAAMEESAIATGIMTIPPHSFTFPWEYDPATSYNSDFLHPSSGFKSGAFSGYLVSVINGSDFARFKPIPVTLASQYADYIDISSFGVGIYNGTLYVGGTIKVKQGCPQLVTFATIPFNPVYNNIGCLDYSAPTTQHVSNGAPSCVNITDTNVNYQGIINNPVSNVTIRLQPTCVPLAMCANV